MYLACMGLGQQTNNGAVETFSQHCCSLDPCEHGFSATARAFVSEDHRAINTTNIDESIYIEVTEPILVFIGAICTRFFGLE